jgi:hypothetical protein
MEMWQGLSYESIVSMPYSRRYRFLLRKIALEKKRQASVNTGRKRFYAQ